MASKRPFKHLKGWQYRYSKTKLYCYSPEGKLYVIPKDRVDALKGSNKRYTEFDAQSILEYDVISPMEEKKRQRELPKTIQELQNLCLKTITIWNWMYPWNHCQQPKEFKNTLVIMGDGFIEARFDYVDDNTFKVLQIPEHSFMAKRNRTWNKLRAGQTLTLEKMRNLSKALV